MLSKILVLVLIVSISKVESQIAKGQNTSPTNGMYQGQSQPPATAAAAAASTTQAGGSTTPRQTQTIPAGSSQSSTPGIVATPRLQLVPGVPGQGNTQTMPVSQSTQPGQGNMQMIPVSQLTQPGQGNMQMIPVSQLTQPGQGNMQMIPVSQLTQPGQGNMQMIPVSQLTQPGQGNMQMIPVSQLTQPGQGNMQMIPISQLTDYTNQQRGSTGAAQGYGYNTGLSGIQAGQIPQLPPLTIAPQNVGLKPSLCGPSSVITGPVSSITIPPSQCATVIDNSLANALANALQLYIAKDVMNACSNTIPDGLPISAETLVPGVDFNALVQTGSQICETADQPGFYDWATILNFLNQPNEPVTPVAQPQADCAYVPELTAFINYLTQNSKSLDQITYQQNVPYQQQVSGSPVIDALAGYFGCNPYELSSYSFPTAPEINFPLEIPAQLVCDYGLMPTTVPVVSFRVEPLTPDGFIIGPRCL